MVVHGLDGLDEVSLSGPTKISRLKDETVTTSQIEPRDVSLSPCSLEEIKGGNAAEKRSASSDVLDGKLGPRRDVALLNAAAALDGS